MIFRKTIGFVENLEMTQMVGDGGEAMFFASLRRNAYKNQYVIHPLNNENT